MTNIVLPIGILGSGAVDLAGSLGAGLVTATDPVLFDEGTAAAGADLAVLSDGDFLPGLLPFPNARRFAPRDDWMEAVQGVFSSSPGRRHGYEAAKHKRAPSLSVPAHPGFSPDDFTPDSEAEMIAAALAFHRQSAIGRPPGFSGSAFTRARQAAIGRAQWLHRLIVFLLEASETLLSLGDKVDLLRLLHGPDEKTRAHLGRFLEKNGYPPQAEEVRAVGREVRKIREQGVPDLIDLVAELEKEEGMAEASNEFLRRLAEGKIILAVIPSTRLDRLEAEEFEAIRADQPMDDFSRSLRPLVDNFVRLMDLPLSSLVAAVGYTDGLTGATALVNAARAHLGELKNYAARIDAALKTLSFPFTFEAEVQPVPAGSDPMEGKGIVEGAPHGLVTVERATLLAYQNYINDLIVRHPQSRVEEHFPVVVAVPTDGVKNDRIDLERVSAIELYVLPPHREGLERLLKRLKPSRTFKVHPFIPMPTALLGRVHGIGNLFELVLSISQSGIAGQAIEVLLNQVEAGPVESGPSYPAQSVEQSREVFRRPEQSVRDGIQSMQRRLQQGTGIDPFLLGNARLVLLLLQDRSLPLEVRAAFSDLMGRHVGWQKLPFMMAMLKRYEEKGDIKALSLEFLAGYFLQMPWAWDIMVEEGLRRTGPLGGLKNRPPFDLRSIVPEDRPAAWRFAYAATRLAGMAEEQAALILKTVAAVPVEADAALLHRRLERLAALTYPVDRNVFRFLENYAAAQDPGGAKLRHFLTRLEARSEAENHWRFQIMVDSLRKAYPHSIIAAQDQLESALEDLAGRDPAEGWDIRDTIALLTYSLDRNVGEAAAAALLRNLALAVQGFARIGGKEEEAGEDRLTQVIRELSAPSRLTASLRDWARGMEHPQWSDPLADLLKRQPDNLSVVQSLLIAFYLQRRLEQPEGKILELLKRERELSALENPGGKIKNAPHLKHALAEVYHFFLSSSLFADATERRIARLTALREDIETVEVIPETWHASVVDFRVTRRGGQTFLMEVKTLYWDHRGPLTVLIERLCDRVAKAGKQLKIQRAISRDQGGDDLIVVSIRVPPGRRLGPEAMEKLRRAARVTLVVKGLEFVKAVLVEQQEL
ncbi:MAG: hypothetical protein HY609_01760 [Deltaproteobacteria bacterium]|nr:hypothetical protein [Deltaproteobacteria bacterium]MBI4223633.1 hypothetical protein [Deltaproteobacteria bacterium]